MCVSQFRDYCNSSKFKYDNREQDIKDRTLQVKKGTHHYNGNNFYYVTDLEKLKELAKAGNTYAKKHLKDLQVESFL